MSVCFEDCKYYYEEPYAGKPHVRFCEGLTLWGVSLLDCSGGIYMKGIKIELLGIATTLLGIALTANTFFGYFLGVLGFGIAVAGCFLKDKDK